ncbi:MAG: hypothetical protein ABI414_12005 [Devosia sp.]
MIILAIWTWATLAIALLQIASYSLIILMVTGLIAFVLGIGLAIWRREWRGWPFVLTLAVSQLLLPITAALDRRLLDPSWLVGAFLLLQLAASAWIVRSMKKSTIAGLMLAWSNMSCALILAVLAAGIASQGYF